MQEHLTSQGPSEEEHESLDSRTGEHELRRSVRGDIREEEPSLPIDASEPDTRVPPPAFALDDKQRENGPLVSASTDASVASSFQSLATSMFLRDSDLIARTAREMLRPMLKQWLDDNLPVMVERLVRAEIERVARGGR